MPKPAPRKCPGLTLTDRGVFWRDCLGREFDLEKEKKLSPGEVAMHMKHSAEWVLRKIRSNELYPCVYHNQRDIEVYECAISDFTNRAHARNNADVAA